jgi:hypothetical protein
MAQSFDCSVAPSRCCIAGTKRFSSPFCVDDGSCTTISVVLEETVDATCQVTSLRHLVTDDLGNPTATVYTGPVNRVKCEVQRVQVVDACSPPSVAPVPLLIPVTAKDCAGANLTQNVAEAVFTIPHPDAVQKVSICPTPAPAPVPIVVTNCGGGDVNVQVEAGIKEVVQSPGTVFDVRICQPNAGREIEKACNALGESVVLTYDTQSIPPTELSRWNLTTNAAEPAGPLGKCDVDDDQIETVELKACLNGVSIPGFAIVTDAATQTVTGEQWRDPATGAWGALPVGAVIGECPTVVVDRKVLVWHESVTGPRTIQDIVAAVGTQYVQSVTVVNVGQGVATITDDFGNTTRLYPGQSWSWSAITGSDARDYLGASALSIDASGTDVHLTATIVP